MMVRTKKLTAMTFASIIASIALFGCNNGAESDRLSKLETQLNKLTAEVSQLKTAPEAQNSNDTSIKPAVQLTSTVTPAAPTEVRFSDIAGRFGEKEISGLMVADVLDGSGTNFDPTKPCKRRDFVRWLVKANNNFGKTPIRLAEPDAKPTFPDVPNSDLDFRYIQGITDAGYSVGYEDKTFKPDRALNREEMIGIKGPFDFGLRRLDYTGYCRDAWNDSKSITAQFFNGLNQEANAGQPNIKRIYGQLKTLNPQKEVTRAEAAVCTYVIDKKSPETKKREE